MEGHGKSLRWSGGALALLALCLVLGGARPAAAVEATELWQALARGEAVALMRHALAPGTGDPAGFDVDDCTTQRNLSDIGRTQAERIGEMFLENGIKQARVWSSAWCRCLETAELLRLGEVGRLPALNSFYTAREREGAQTADVKAWLAARQESRPLVLVTHQVNITALAGVYPVSGEIVVIRQEPDGEVKVLGSIRPDGKANASRCDCGEEPE